jgi:hypothetical protein
MICITSLNYLNIVISALSPSALTILPNTFILSTTTLHSTLQRLIILHTMPLCWMCEQITPWTLNPIAFDGVCIRDPTSCNTHHRSFQGLEDSASNCELCKLVCDSFLHSDKTPRRGIRREDPVHMGAWMRPPRDPESNAPQISNIIVQCGEVHSTLLAFADPYSEVALVQDVIGRLPPEPESKAQYEMVARWLDECMHDHPACKLTAGQGKANMRTG